MGNGQRDAFTRFKEALAANGINYDRLIAVASADKTARLEANATASLTLYSDAKAKSDRFAICDKRGNPVWHGRFFATDHNYNGEQSSGEIAAAKKAVWLASKVKETLGLPAIKLALKVNAEWLCYANAVRQGNPGGGRARALGDLAIRSGVVLTVEHIVGGLIARERFDTRLPRELKGGMLELLDELLLPILQRGLDDPLDQHPAPAYALARPTAGRRAAARARQNPLAPAMPA
jgi:hypothetical protein